MYHFFLYIETDPEYRDIFFAVIFFGIFVSMIIVAWRMNKTGLNTSKSSVDAKMSVWLFRVTAAKFISESNYSFKDIKDRYIVFLKQLGMSSSAELQYETEQLKYLVDNKVNVEKSILKGKGEMHKKKLLVLTFFLNYCSSLKKKDAYILLFTNEIRKKWNISDSVYNKIIQKYLTDHEYEQNRDIKILQKGIRISNAYRTLQIPKGASLSEVKDAYRKLAKLYHPDVSFQDQNETNSAENKFNQITEAYDLLKNELS